MRYTVATFFARIREKVLAFNRVDYSRASERFQDLT